jgi:hypothetical protein
MHAILGASPACVATHPSDMCVALVALDAIVHTDGSDGPSSMPLVDLHRLPSGRPDVETELRPHELITAVELPALPFAARSTYRKVRHRASYAFALVSVAAALDVVDGKVRDVRLALGGVAPKPWSAWKAEEVLRGQPATRASFCAPPKPSSPTRRDCATTGSRSNWQGGRSPPSSANSRESRREHHSGRRAEVIQTAIRLAPEGWLPGGAPDPLMRQHGLIGAPISRVNGR